MSARLWMKSQYPAWNSRRISDLNRMLTTNEAWLPSCRWLNAAASWWRVCVSMRGLVPGPTLRPHTWQVANHLLNWYRHGYIIDLKFRTQNSTNFNKIWFWNSVLKILTNLILAYIGLINLVYMKFMSNLAIFSIVCHRTKPGTWQEIITWNIAWCAEYLTKCKENT